MTGYCTRAETEHESETSCSAIHWGRAENLPSNSHHTNNDEIMSKGHKSQLKNVPTVKTGTISVIK
jgi:hypothetical protein